MAIPALLDKAFGVSKKAEQVKQAVVSSVKQKAASQAASKNTAKYTGTSFSAPTAATPAAPTTPTKLPNIFEPQGFNKIATPTPAVPVAKTPIAAPTAIGVPANVKAETPKEQPFISKEEIISYYSKSKKKPSVMPNAITDIVPLSPDAYAPNDIFGIDEEIKQASQLGKTGLPIVMDLMFKRKNLVEENNAEFEQLPFEEQAKITAGATERKLQDLRNQEFINRAAGAFDESLKGANYWGEKLTAQKEADILKKQALLDIPGGLVRGAMAGLSLGTTDVLLPDDQKATTPMYQQNKELMDGIQTAKVITGGLGNLAGGLVTYSAISGLISKIGSKLPGAVGQFYKESPALAQYVLSNTGEELVEVGVRKATGQQYGMVDFALGILMGTGMQTILSPKGLKKAFREAESLIKKAEELKGTKLDAAEVDQILGDIKVDPSNLDGAIKESDFIKQNADRLTLRDIRDVYGINIGQARQAFLKGGKKGTPGIDYPAPLPIKKDIHKDFTDAIKEVKEKFDLTDYKPEDYADFKTVLDENKSVGYAIKPDGDLVSVFNKGAKGEGKFAVIDAIENGANKLDAFDGKLVEYYKKYGFEEYKREPNWKAGEPDVVYMKLNKSKYEQFKKSNPAFYKGETRPVFERNFRADGGGDAGVGKLTSTKPEKAEIKQVGDTVERNFKVPTEAAMIAEADKGIADEFKLAHKETIAGPMVGEIQAQEFKLGMPAKNIAKKIQQRKLTVQDSEAIGSFIDNPTAHPLSTELRTKIGDDLISDISAYKKLMTEEQQKAGLLTNAMNEDEYLRTYLTSIDGKPVTSKQLFELNKASDASQQAKFLGIIKNSGGESLSTKNRFDVERMFKNADERDEFLKEFGLKTNRNIFEVLEKQRSDVTKITSNKLALDKVREGAKAKVKGVREWYDPSEYKAFQEQIKTDVSNLKESILREAKQQKLITQQKYDLEMTKAKESVAALMKDLKEDKMLRGDIGKNEIDALNESFAAFKANLMDNLKGAKQTVKDSMEKELDLMKSKYMDIRRNKINENISKAVALEDEGYIPLSKVKGVNARIANSFPGLMFNKPSANAIAKIFAESKGSSFSRLAQTLKTYKASGDLFMGPEVIKQAYAARGLKGFGDLKAMLNIRMPEKVYYNKGMDAIRTGLVLDRPSDQLRSLVKNMGEKVVDENLTAFEKGASKVAGAISEAPVIGKLAKGANKILEKSNEIQYDLWIPQTKLQVWDNMWPKIRKQYKGLTDEQAKIMTSRVVNDMFQGINFKRMMTDNTLFGRWLDKNKLRTMQSWIFGPDKNVAVARRFTGAFKKYGAPYRAAMVRSMGVGFTGLQMLSYAITGHSTFENKRGSEFDLEIPFIKDEKGNPLAVNILGTWAEPLKAINKPGEFAFNKLGPLPQAFKEFVPGMPYKKGAAGFAEDFIPIPLTLQNLIWQPFQSEKIKTGETDFGTAAIQSGLNVIGFGSTFRSGGSKTTTMADVVTGKSGLWEYLSSAPVPAKKEETETLDFSKKPNFDNTLDFTKKPDFSKTPTSTNKGTGKKLSFK